MQMAGGYTVEVIHFETSIRIERPADDVFAVVADPQTYPRWNSAVEAVTPVEGERRFRMERELPTGHAENVLEVLYAEPPREVVVRAADGPTPFLYRFVLAGSNGATDLSLKADVELGGASRLFGPLAAAAVKRGVDENFSTLKRLLERG
jgi:uncharacterized protein YndB with AHSA1/START domain